jgi:hypothetical protein
MWRHMVDSGWLAADVSVTHAVDQRWAAVHWSTVDRPMGHTPDLIWTVHRRSGGKGHPRAIQGGGDGRRRRRTAAPVAELAGARSNMSSRPPNRTGRTLNERGGHKELTRGLGQEEDMPEKEIGASAELRLGLFGAAALRGEGEGGRAQKICGVDRGLCPPFYRVERGRGGDAEAVGSGGGH